MDQSGVLYTKVVRMRTFKDDVARARSEKNVPAEIETTQVNTPQEKPLPAPQKTITPPQKIHTITRPKVVGSTSLPKPLVSVPKNLTTIKVVPVAKSTVTAKPIHGLTSEEVAKIGTYTQGSILSDENTLHSAHALGEGTIVRDTKRKRFRLIPAIITSVTDWFATTKSEYEKAAQSKVHTVAKAETRLETIKKAVDQERLAPKDDSTQVAQTLAHKEQPDIQTGLLVKEKEDLPVPSWTHTVDEQTPPQEETPHAAIVTTQTPLKAEAQVHTPKESFTIQTSDVEETKESIIEDTPVSQPQYKIVLESPLQKVLPQERTDAVPPRTSYQAAPTSEGRFYLVFAAVIFLATLLGVGVSYYLFGIKSDTGVLIQEEKTYTAPSLFTAATQIEIALEEDRDVFLQQLADTTVTATSQGALHIVPVFQNDGGTLPADTESILESLALRTEGSFSRNIKEIALGSEEKVPFIVMKVATFDTAFAGMLSWENAMSIDLSPLFGTPVYESFNPEARTSTQTTDPYFRDIITSNKSARVLVDENNDDRIIYTFVDQNTILVTTTREALAGILTLIK